MNKNGETKKILIENNRFWEALRENFLSNIVIISEKHLKLCGKTTWHAYLF